MNHSGQVVDDQLCIRQLPGSPVRQHTPSRTSNTLPHASHHPLHTQHSFGLPSSPSNSGDAVKYKLPHSNSLHGNGDGPASMTSGNGGVTSPFSRQHTFDALMEEDASSRYHSNDTSVNNHAISAGSFSPSRRRDIAV